MSALPLTPDLPDQMASGESEAHSPLSRSLLTLAVGGFVIVIFALFFLQWPVPRIGDVPGAMNTQIHLKRVEMRFSGGEANNVPGAILDVLAYVAVGAGIVLTIWAVRARQRMALIGLMMVGLFGLAYSGGMALYIGPMISLCGFILIFFVGLILLITFPDDETLQREKPSGTVDATPSVGFVPMYSESSESSPPQDQSDEAPDRAEDEPDAGQDDSAYTTAATTAAATQSDNTDIDGTPSV